MKPSNFTSHPMGSISQNSETETIASNIMKILQRTGNIFRKLTFKEYKKERLKDKDFSSIEEDYFNTAIKHCDSADNAQLFCDDWKKE